MDSATKEIVLRGQHVVQIALSLYGAVASFVAITNLQKYEATAKKLAEWSKQAETELSKTRFTQGSGAIAVSRLCPLGMERTVLKTSPDLGITPRFIRLDHQPFRSQPMGESRYVHQYSPMFRFSF